ncbi:outer membrane beta-barrel protein [Coraliomargarita sp. W4R72]
MKNKQLCLLSLISSGLLLQADVSAAPLVSIGDNTDVFFNGSSSLRWSSNVFRDEDSEQDDLIWSLSPGFEINVGRGVSNADLSIITRYDIIRYEDLSELDTELFHIKAVGSYRTSRLDLSASVSFDENKSSSGENNIDNDLIEFDTFNASINGEYRLSPKFSVGSGVRYAETDYTTYDDLFADRETYSIPLDVFYELTPKVDLSFGYVYSNTDVSGTEREGVTFVPFASFVRNSGDYEYDSHFFNIGARGNLLPKLSGFFKVGYRMRDSDDSTVQVTSTTIPGGITSTATSRTDREDSGMLGLDADLTWAATPKVTVNLGLSRDFGVGGEGQSTENSSVDLTSSYSINSYFAASANLGYTLRDYTNADREDNQYRGGLRLSYAPNQFWRFSTGYTYSENDSNEVDRSYDNHTIDLTATLRY